MHATYWINPVTDPRWAEFIHCHPRSSVFHTPGWFEALHRTYGFEPAVLTTSLPGQKLQNGIPFCHVSSWLTGKRLVSLPFSDHCNPLAERPEELASLLEAVRRKVDSKKLKYAEIRPRESALELGDRFQPFEPAQSYYFHSLDLRPPLDALVRNFHRDCVRRKIRRADRDNLIFLEGRSDALLGGFFTLQVITRRRQHLPPQPEAWFRNIIKYLGDKVNIRLAIKDGKAIAGIMTLRYRNSMVYKYGCSDARFNNLGGFQAIFWKAIQEAKALGLEELDMGRSDPDNHGLVVFKERWGALRSQMAYLRCPSAESSAFNAMYSPIAKRMFRCLPRPILTAAGRLLYRHFA